MVDLSSIIYKKFNNEIVSMIGRKVVVETSEGKNYEGDLVGVDGSLNVILDNVSGVGENVYKVVLNRDFLKEIRLVEKPFDLKALAERLNRVFPGLVRIREDIRSIIVMDKIKVTEQGVEGSGLAVERVKSVYDEFVRESKK
ncbi:MAG: Lsm family RNA-binding protein [Candidatus Methylarchaceae archaeon HK01B]|nr:Lsm family RNA-binding protein [Candidatus Methylarchaceae archaeon HK01B]